MIIKVNTGNYLSVYMFFLLIFGLSECGAYNVIATGPHGGNYEQTGQELSQIIGRSSLIKSSGSTTNLRGLFNGEFTIAIAQSDVASYAYTGTGVFERIGKFTHLRTIGTAYLEYIYLIVPADSHIKSIKDLQGKHLSMGLPGSGTLATSTTILAANGFNATQYMPHYFGFKKLMRQLKEGKLDAAFIIDKSPSPLLLTLSRNMPIRLIPLELKDMVQTFPTTNFYKQSCVAGRNYNISQDIPTLTVEAQIFVTSDMPAQTAFKLAEFVKKVSDPSVKGLNSKEITALNYPPYHLGAADFYRQQESG